MVNYNIDVYLKHTEMENMYARELIELVTNDINGNIFNFTIHESENTYDLTGKSVKLIVKSENGTIIEDDCTATDAVKGKASITLPSGMFCEGGTYYAEVQIWNGISRITTLPFDYNVRLSLETDEAVKADNRFSLLQQALADVANADETATSALNRANEAIDKIASFNQAVADVNQLKNDLYPLHDEIKNKNQLNGVGQTSSNFIENQVVQDGLLSLNQKWFNIGEKSVSSGVILDDIADDYFLSCRFYNSDNSLGLYPFGNYNSTDGDYMGFTILVGSSGGLSIFVGVEDGSKRYYESINGSGLFSSNTWYNLALSKVGDIFSIYVNGNIVYDTSIPNYRKSNRNLIYGGYSSNSAINKPICNLYTYSRLLRGDEYSYNESILNSSPSILGTEIDNQFYINATDSEHVITKAGHTAEEELDSFRSLMKEEFTAGINGEIKIGNGIDKSKVLNAEIQGKTLKNFITNTGYTNAYKQKGYIETVAPIGETSTHFDVVINSTNSFVVEPGGTYDFVYYVEECETDTTLFSHQRLVIWYKEGGSTHIPVSGSQLNFSSKGMYVATVKLADGLTPNKLSLWMKAEIGKSITSTTRVSKIAIVPKGMGGFVKEQLSPGLNSVRAAIARNGHEYVIYEHTAEGSAKPIELNGIEGVSDKSILFKTGTVVSKIQCKKVNVDGNMPWKYTGGYDNESTMLFRLEGLDKAPGNVNLSADNFELNTSTSATVTKEGLTGHGTNSIVYLRIKREKLPTQDLQGLKEYVNNNNFELVYISTNPRYIFSGPITIPMGITNVFQVDSAVYPSSFKIVAPINFIELLLVRVEALEAKINTRAVNVHFIEEVYAKSVNKIEEVNK